MLLFLAKTLFSSSSGNNLLADFYYSLLKSICEPSFDSAKFNLINSLF